MSHFLRSSASRIVRRSPDAARGSQAGQDSPPNPSAPTDFPQNSEESLLMPVGLTGLRQLRDVFKVLKSALMESPISIDIPETVFVSENGRDCLLFTDEKRTLRCSESGDVLSQFLAQCAQRSPVVGEGKAPLYIFHSVQAGHKVMFETEEAERMWKVSRESTKRMQRFISSQPGEPSKLRIIWSRTGELKRLRITRKAADMVFQRRRTHRSQTFNAATSSYKYDLCAFTHAGQLKKSSFSPLLPFRSVLMEEMKQKAQPHPEASDFIISTKVGGSFEVEETRDPAPRAERIAIVLREVLQRFYAAEDEIVETLACDVLQSFDGSCYLLDTKWIVVGKRPALTPTAPTYAHFSEKAAPQTSTPDRERNVRKKFSELMHSPKSSSQVRKAPFIDLKEIQSQNAKTYLSSVGHMRVRSLVGSSSPTDPMLPYLRSSLDSAEGKLNRLISAATAHRKKAREIEYLRLLQYSDKTLDFVLTRVYDRVRTDPILGKFFHGKNKTEVNMIKTGFFSAFTSIDNFLYHKNIRQVHKGQRISTANFAHFVELFTGVLREEGIQTEDIERVRAHLSKFESLIVEDDETIL